MSTRTMAVVSIEARILWLDGQIQNIKSAYSKLVNKDTEYAKEHVMLLNCYFEVLSVYKWHYNRIVLSVNAREECPTCAGWGHGDPTRGEPDGATCAECDGSGKRKSV